MGQHCKVQGCTKDVHARGFCKSHYRHFKKYGDPEKYIVELHGDSNSPEYKSWIAMKARCLNTNAHAYERYGGIGITVCDEWKESYTKFLEDMGRKPNIKDHIDRIDGTKGYSKLNCRWLSLTENNRNKRTTKLNMEYAEKIRDLYATNQFSHRELGLIYHVAPTVVGRIIRRSIWI